MILFILTICGKESKSSDSLNENLFLNPSTFIPCLIKSYGLKEKQPTSDKSASICIVCAPIGTPQIIKSPALFVLTVYL